MSNIRGDRPVLGLITAWPNYYDYFMEYVGAWQTPVYSGTSGSGDAHIFQAEDNVGLNGRARSVDGGSAWSPEVHVTGQYAWQDEAVYYGEQAHYVYLGHGDPPRLMVSSNYGGSYATNYITQPSPVLDPAYHWDVRSIKIKQQGEVYCLWQPRTAGGDWDTSSAVYFSKSLDLGATWSTPVLAMGAAPQPWTGGTILGGSARNYDYIAIAVNATGQKIACCVLEGETEIEYTPIPDCYYFQWPGDDTTKDYDWSYFPQDILIVTSVDGGASWGSVVRNKMDENQDDYTSDVYFWGQKPPALPPEEVSNHGVYAGVYGDTLCVFMCCWQGYRDDDFYLTTPEPLIGYKYTPYGPDYLHCIAMLTDAGWDGNLSRLSEDDTETVDSWLVAGYNDDCTHLFVIGGGSGGVYEEFHNGVIGPNSIWGTPAVQFDISFALELAEEAYTYFF